MMSVILVTKPSPSTVSYALDMADDIQKVNESPLEGLAANLGPSWPIPITSNLYLVRTEGVVPGQTDNHALNHKMENYLYMA